jgi:hypothetical protein
MSEGTVQSVPIVCDNHEGRCIELCEKPKNVTPICRSVRESSRLYVHADAAATRPAVGFRHADDLSAVWRRNIPRARVLALASHRRRHVLAVAAALRGVPARRAQTALRVLCEEAHRAPLEAANLGSAAVFLESWRLNFFELKIVHCVTGTILIHVHSNLK